MTLHTQCFSFLFYTFIIINQTMIEKKPLLIDTGLNHIRSVATTNQHAELVRRTIAALSTEHSHPISTMQNICYEITSQL